MFPLLSSSIINFTYTPSCSLYIASLRNFSATSSLLEKDKNFFENKDNFVFLSIFLIFSFKSLNSSLDSVPPLYNLVLLKLSNKPLFKQLYNK